MQPLEIGYTSVNRAFSAQAANYDAEDARNPVLQHWRQCVYKHVNGFLKPHSHILEINAGTGIDAIYFSQRGHVVLATDLSDGMVNQLKEKSKNDHNLSALQLSFEQLDRLEGKKFDYVFSNFGGLNCTPDLSPIAKNLPKILNPGAHLTWVIMPRITPWEWLWTLKGKWKDAFRRLKKGGVQAHVNGTYFTTHYHSLSSIQKALGKSFRLERSEALGLFSPPPSAQNFVQHYPSLFASLKRSDQLIGKVFPFNRIGDHIIITFQFQP